LASPHSKRAYGAALSDFWGWCQTQSRPALTKGSVQRYKARLEADGLAPSSINVRLSAIRRLALAAANHGLVPADAAAEIAQIHGAKRSVEHTGNWLTRDQAQRLIEGPDTSTLKGKRDRALFTVMIGCGLRRNEVAELRFDHIQRREGRWAIVDLVGKRGRVRTVPMPAWAKAAIDAWAGAAGLREGRVFQAINKADRITHGTMTAHSIFETVKHYAAKDGSSTAPDDLRRTYAKLAHGGRASLEQIQLSLGHASIVTTERYLGVRQASSVRTAL
jgi:site-specific recombinase XerD